jgi:hypothetical protein
MKNINNLQTAVSKAKASLSDRKFQRRALMILGTVAVSALGAEAMAAATNFATNQDGQTLVNLVCTQVGKYKLYVAGALAVWKLGSAAVQYTTGQPGAVVNAGVGVFGGLAIMTGPKIALGLFGLSSAGC